MSIRFVEIKASPSSETLNAEWVVLENTGAKAIHTRGCGMTVGKMGSNQKSMLGVIDPGFVLEPGKKMRMCTGSPSTEAHGKPPEDDVPNYFLFLDKTYVRTEGVVLTLTLRGLPIAKALYAAASANGVKA